MIETVAHALREKREDLIAQPLARIWSDLAKAAVEAAELSPKSDREIICEVNDLARIMLRFIGTGYEVPEGHKFYQAPDSRSQKAWAAAVEVYELITKSDVGSALAAVDED